MNVDNERKGIRGINCVTKKKGKESLTKEKRKKKKKGK